MKLVCFLIVCLTSTFGINAQLDTIFFDGGKHYSDHLVILPKHVNLGINQHILDFNPHHENYLYLNADSTFFNGIVYSSGNRERSIKTYYVFDEFNCLIQDGFKKYCTIETLAYFPMDSIDIEQLLWRLELTNVYYSNSGRVVDSIQTSRFDELHALTFLSTIYYRNGIETRFETKFHNNDTLYHGSFVNNKMHGDWIETTAPVDLLTSSKSTKIITIYNHGILEKVIGKNIYYLNFENKIIDESVFIQNNKNSVTQFNRFYEFTSADKKESTESFIVVTANPNYLYDFPLDQVNFVKKQLNRK